MTRQEIDTIIQQENNTGVANTSPNLIDFAQPHSTGLGNGIAQTNVESYLGPNTYNKPTAGDMQDIVNAMTDDTRWTRSEETGNFDNRLSVGMLPTTQPREWYSNYPGEENADFLYNNPQYKAIEDYFADQGLSTWLNGSRLAESPKSRDTFAKLLNLAQGMNEYNLRQDTKEFKQRFNEQNLYGDTLAEMLGQTGAYRSLVDEAMKQAELQKQQEAKQALADRARQRDITGSGYGAIAW